MFPTDSVHDKKSDPLLSLPKIRHLSPLPVIILYARFGRQQECGYVSYGTNFPERLCSYYGFDFVKHGRTENDVYDFI